MNTQPSIAEIDQDGILAEHKIALAECIIEWARYESQLRALLSVIEGLPLDEGAQRYHRVSPEDAWKKIKKALRSAGASNQVLEAVQNNREGSRQFYETRKLIVHAGCVGVWKVDRDYLVFAPFESERAAEMALYWVPLIDITRSTTFARAALKLALRILALLGH